jgi:hypothetical protein
MGPVLILVPTIWNEWEMLPGRLLVTLMVMVSPAVAKMAGPGKLGKSCVPPGPGTGVTCSCIPLTVLRPASGEMSEANTQW